MVTCILPLSGSVTHEKHRNANVLHLHCFTIFSIRWHYIIRVGISTAYVRWLLVILFFSQTMQKKGSDIIGYKRCVPQLHRHIFKKLTYQFSARALYYRCTFQLTQYPCHETSVSILAVCVACSNVESSRTCRSSSWRIVSQVWMMHNFPLPGNT